MKSPEILDAAAPEPMLDGGVDIIPAIPDPINDSSSFVEDALLSIQSGRYALFAVLGLMVVSRGLVAILDMWPKRFTWFTDGLRSWLVGFIGVLTVAIASVATVGAIDTRAIIGIIVASVALELKLARRKPVK